MYKNLEAELKRTGFTRKEIAEVIGTQPGAAYKKLSGQVKLSCHEAMLIKTKLFPDLSMEYLFDETVGA